MEESRTKKTTRNIFSSSLLQFLTIFLQFIVRIVFVRTLGEEYLGINGLFSNIISILSLADLGLTSVLMYNLYKPIALKDEQMISKYLNYYKKIFHCIAGAVLLIGILVTPLLQYIVNLPSEMPDMYLYYFILLANTVLSYLFVYKTTLLIADQKTYILNRYDIISNIILFVVQIIILVATRNFALYLISWLMYTIIVNILKVKKTEKIYPYLKKERVEKLTKTERRGIFQSVYSMMFYRFGGVIQTYTDNILISIFVGTTMVGYYSNYIAIILGVTTFVNIIFLSLKASLGNYIVGTEKSEQIKMFKMLEVYNFWIVAFCSVCLLVLIPDFIEMCFGSEYVLGNSILILIVFNFYISNIRQTIWAYRETTGLFKKTKFIIIVTSVLNLVLSIIFGKLYGIIGILGATIFSKMVYEWWKEPLILYNDYFKVTPYDYFIKYILRIILVIGMCALIYVLCSTVDLENMYLTFILKCLICVIIPNIILLAIYRKNEAVEFIIEKIKSRWQRQV